MSGFETYYNRLAKSCERLESFRIGLDTDEQEMREQLYRYYVDKHLDPDGYAKRKVFDVECTADGLLTLYQICRYEEMDNIIPTYREYGREPIIFFPCEMGGINTSRAMAFWDRIDHTLFDLKNYFTEGRDGCRLLKAYNRPLTQSWLKGMGSFEKIIDWWGVKGIFTDENYDVLDIETGGTSVIYGYRTHTEYRKQWGKEYYGNLKERLALFFYYADIEKDNL